MQRSFKGVWIPKEIWENKEMGWSEKLLLVEIDSLDNENGCWASNEYFAEFFSLSKDRISKMISSLKSKGYVTVELVYKEGTKSIEKRVVRITDRYRRKQLEGIVENNYTPIGENTEDNNTVINNTFNNTNKDNKSSKLDNIPYKEIIDYLNEKTNKNYRQTSKKTRDFIKARWIEGFRLNDFKQVIDIKTPHWLNDPKMDKYLRPETLFGTKFESYLNEKVGVNNRSYQQSHEQHSEPESDNFSL